MISHLLAPAVFTSQQALVEGDAYRHLFRARRLAVGERLRVVDGLGHARWAEVTRIDRRAATLSLGQPAPSHEPDYQLALLVAPIRPERASWLVEKATELGVSAIRFLASERAPRRFGPGTLERLARVARAAVVQSHRATVPAITGVHGWYQLERLLVGFGDRFFLDPEAAPSAQAQSQSLSGVVVVGPEGGFAPVEQKTLARMATAVCFGPRILRTETAALAAAAKLMA